MTKPLVVRAMLVGAYRRRGDCVHRGHPTDDADVRIAELEGMLSEELIGEAREIAKPSVS